MRAGARIKSFQTDLLAHICGVGVLATGTVPAGQDTPAAVEPFCTVACGGFGVLPAVGLVGEAVGEFGLAVVGLAGFCSPGNGALVVDPACAVVPFTGTQVTAPGVAGVAPGWGAAVVGAPVVVVGTPPPFSGAVPGAGVWGVVEVSGPAAFVVIGVGGPMVVGGVVIVGLAGTAAGAAVAEGAGAVGVVV